eukprot:tig00020903_g15132.t1
MNRDEHGGSRIRNPVPTHAYGDSAEIAATNRAESSQLRGGVDAEPPTRVKIAEGLIATSPGQPLKPEGVITHINDGRAIAASDPKKYSTENDGSQKSLALLLVLLQALSAGLRSIVSTLVQGTAVKVNAKEAADERCQELGKRILAMSKTERQSFNGQRLLERLKKANAELESAEAALDQPGTIKGLPSYMRFLISKISPEESEALDTRLKSPYDGSPLPDALKAVHDLLPSSTLLPDGQKMKPIDIVKTLESQINRRAGHSGGSYTNMNTQEGHNRYRNFLNARDKIPELKRIALEHEPEDDASADFREMKLASFMTDAFAAIPPGLFVELGTFEA